MSVDARYEFVIGDKRTQAMGDGVIHRICPKRTNENAILRLSWRTA